VVCLWRANRRDSENDVAGALHTRMRKLAFEQEAGATLGVPGEFMTMQLPA